MKKYIVFILTLALIVCSSGLQQTHFVYANSNESSWLSVKAASKTEAAKKSTDKNAKSSSKENKTKKNAKPAAADKKAKEKSKPAAAEKKAKEKSKSAAAEKKTKEKSKTAATEKKTKEKSKPAAAEKKAEEKSKPAATEEKNKEESKPAATEEKNKEESKPAATEEKTKEENKDAGAKPMAVYKNKASADNPIGDNGAYYKVDGLDDSPDITAESATVIDATTGYVLYAKQSEEKRYPASITKVMTALLAIEKCDLNEKVPYTEKILNTVEAGSSSAGIGAGAELTMEQSLYALMLASANEAAAAIACHISGSDEEFGKLMTRRAKQLGCKDTTFKNPHGLPNEKHVTTAHDMALILKKAMEYKEFRTIAGTVSYTIESKTLPAPIELYNHARILQSQSEYYYKNAKGAKTGFTQAALNTLVTWAKKDDTELICVILKDYGADRSYIDTRNLFRWGYEQVKTIHPAKNFDLTAWVSENKDKVSKELRQGLRTLDYSFYKNYPILVKKNFDNKNVSCRFVEKLDKEKGILGTLEICNGDDLMGALTITYDTTSTEGRAFNNAGNDDDMSVANMNKGKVSPHFFLIILGIMFAVLLVLFILLQVKRARRAEKRRKQRILKRRESRVKAPDNPHSRYNAEAGQNPAPAGSQADIETP